MDEYEKQEALNRAIQARRTSGPKDKEYSLLEIQLTDGSVVGMTISAGPTIGQHLVKEMGNGGWLYAFNDTESLIIKADRVVAVKLTKLTRE